MEMKTIEFVITWKILYFILLYEPLQVLVNRERLVKRLHQQRSAYRILGQPNNDVDDKTGEDNVVDDDDDDVEVNAYINKKAKGRIFEMRIYHLLLVI